MDRDRRFYFLEMNTRLQVEHPVTELVSGADLVVEQIRIAAGERVSLRQEDVRLSGWALECRVTAENPFDNFLPSLGCIDYLAEPSGPGVRVDSALFSGSELPYHYDPMVAKVITWGRDRSEAIQRMQRALSEFVIVGIETNIPFHLQMLADARFLAGDISTSFLEKEFSMAPPSDGTSEQVALLATALLTHLKRRSAPLTEAPAANGSRVAPRRARSRLRGARHGMASKYQLRLGDREAEVEVEEKEGGLFHLNAERRLIPGQPGAHQPIRPLLHHR